MGTRSRVALVAAIAAAITGMVAGAAAAEGLKQIGTIALPGEALTQFGAVFVDQQTGRGFLTNRDNKSIDVFDARSDTFIARVGGFLGIRPSGSPVSGPQGVVTANDGAEAWASDGDSTIKVIDVAQGKIVATISTGGKKRVGELAYDPADHVVLVTNTNDEPPFLTLVSTGPDRKVMARIELPSATDGIERPNWFAGTGLFYVPLPKIDHDEKAGGLAVIDPRAGKLVAIHRFEDCVPHSVAEVGGGLLYLGCDVPGERLAVFDPRQNKVIAYVPKLGGGGQTAADTNGRYYAAINRHPGGPQLKVIDAKARTLVQTIPAATGAHAVAVFVGNHHVYVPESNAGACGGCIKVYAPE